jgi:hypothetical protein
VVEKSGDGGAPGSGGRVNAAPLVESSGDRKCGNGYGAASSVSRARAWGSVPEATPVERVGTEESDLVCATIEARWVLPVLQLLRELGTSHWRLRFFADRCGSAFNNAEMMLIVRTQWSCDAFCAYRVGTMGAATAVRVGNVELDPSCADMRVSVSRLSTLLDPSTKPTDRVMFRATAGGACSVCVGDGARLEWTRSEATNASDDVEIDDRTNAYMSVHAAHSSSFDARQWRSHWRGLPRQETTQFVQSADALRLTLSANGSVRVSVIDKPATVTALPKDVSNKLLQLLRPLSAYKFATDRVRVQCIGKLSFVCRLRSRCCS